MSEAQVVRLAFHPDFFQFRWTPRAGYRLRMDGREVRLRASKGWRRHVRRRKAGI